MRDFAFAEAPLQLVPTHKRSTFGIAVIVHAVVIAALILIKLEDPVRVSSAGSPSGPMIAYIAAPISAAPAAAPKPREAKMALKTEAAKDEVQPDAGTAAGSAGVVGADQMPAGPVRLGAGGNITPLRKVQPVYPPMMQTARISGAVTLDAIIHADGTIGDVTVLQSSNPAFTRSAIDAVKQWKYAPIGFEAILTVTVTFTLK
jgi:TonB family protein